MKWIHIIEKMINFDFFECPFPKQFPDIFHRNKHKSSFFTCRSFRCFDQKPCVFYSVKFWNGRFTSEFHCFWKNIAKKRCFSKCFSSQITRQHFFKKKRFLMILRGGSIAKCSIFQLFLCFDAPGYCKSCFLKVRESDFRELGQHLFQ